jgi:hypothetical protein
VESKKTQDGPKRVLSDLREGTYSDGHPLDDVHYLECKIILKGDRFTSVENFHDFSRIVRQTAEAAEVDYSTEEFKGLRPQIREVLFADTQDFRLYNNAFILRRRVNYVDGFAVGDPEIVFKFRHPDLQKTAEMDVRPKFVDDYRIKFKAEALPLKDQIGSYRLLYSHNAQFPLSRVHEADRTSMKTLSRVFPVLETIKTPDADKVELVNATAVEEVLLDIGLLTSAKELQPKQTWHLANPRRPETARRRIRVSMQVQAPGRIPRCHQEALRTVLLLSPAKCAGLISLGTTKTGSVYRLKGNPPQAHE